MTTQSYELVPIDQLRPHPRNPRRQDIARIRESIQVNGFVGTVVAQRSSGTILAGHGRTEAAAAEGLTEVPTVWVDVDDDTALRILLADNRASDGGGYDEVVLAEVLAELAALGTGEGLFGTGYDNDALEDLLSALSVESFDDLARRIKEPEERDLWPSISIKAPPDLVQRFNNALRAMPGAPDQVAQLEALVSRCES